VSLNLPTGWQHLRKLRKATVRQLKKKRNVCHSPRGRAHDWISFTAKTIHEGCERPQTPCPCVGAVFQRGVSGTKRSGCCFIKVRVPGKRPIARQGCDPVLLGQILRALAANEFLAGLQELERSERDGQLSLPPDSQACSARHL